MNKKKKSEEIEESVEQAEQVETTDENEHSESQYEESEDINFQDKYMRLYAEFDNFRKRTMREKAELIGSASSDIMLQLLPLVDDFDRAQDNETDDVAALKEGMELIHSKLIATLSSKGLKAMKTKTGDNFDLDKHEAIANIPAPTEDLKGKVVDIVEKGYMLGDKVLRYAKVVIGA
ncbi:MAG: nucleotide exchange factor GrpE [Bacteroidota bacterium]|nr:nucleotide exchange factor GrpE [Bacteroidota bacterium]